MDIPSNPLSSEETTAYLKMAQAAIADWKTIKTSTNAQEYAAYRELISNASQGIKTILAELKRNKRDLENKMGSVELLLKDLDRHEELAKTEYWSLRRP
jgi:hypothetical protein